MKFSLSFVLSILLLSFCATSLLGQNNSKGKYTVVVNTSGQYSVWIGGSILSDGWREAGYSGTLNQCQAYIKEVWTDMRPRSIQKLNLPANTRYKVVINHEEQYSIWPANRKAPKGWRDTKKAGNLRACMAYIEEVWTDMRPLSLRK